MIKRSLFTYRASIRAAKYLTIIYSYFIICANAKCWRRKIFHAVIKFASDYYIWEVRNKNLIFSILSVPELLAAVNNLPCKPFLFFIWKVWFVTVKQSKEQHHKIPCLNGKWEHISQRPDQVTVEKKERRKKKEEQALLDFVWMTPMFSAVPENELWSQWETLTVPTTHMALTFVFVLFFYSAFDICFYLIMKKIVEWAWGKKIQTEKIWGMKFIADIWKATATTTAQKQSVVGWWQMGDLKYCYLNYYHYYYCMNLKKENAYIHMYVVWL